MYISRAVLPYLCLQNLRDAQSALNTFIQLLCSGHNIPPHSTIEGVEIFPSLPLLNYLSLLCVACQRGAPEFFNGLKKQYSHSLEEVPWNDVSASSTCMLTDRRWRRLVRFGLALKFLDSKGI